MRHTHDLIIVGASIAGASLAASLGGEGFRVALCDRHHFPRAKPCGEGLSKLGLDVFRDLGLSRAVLECPHRPYEGFSLWPSDARSPVVLRNEENLGICIQRKHLDTALVKAAMQSQNVEFFPSVHVREVLVDPDQPQVSIPARGLSAPYLVLAEGARGFLAQKLGFERVRPKALRYGLKMLFAGQRDPSRPLVSIFIERDHEVYCSPLGDGLLNVALIGPKAIIRSFTEVNRQRQLQRELQERLDYFGDLVEPPCGAGPLGERSSCASCGPILLAGDVLECLDPLGGMGMSHAVTCARLAAQAFRSISSGAIGYQDAFRLYARQREREMRLMRGFTRLAVQTFRHIAPRAVFRSLSRVPVLPVISGALSLDSMGISEAAARAMLRLAGV